MKISEIIQFLDFEFPFSSAEEWDNCGLIVGNKDSEVTKILVCLDVSEEAIRYADSIGCELIISHHPVIFRAKKKFCAGSVDFEAARRNITIVSIHTNLDKATDGVNDSLCEILGLKYEKVCPPFCNGFLNIAELDERLSAKQFAQFVKNRLNTSVSYVDGGRLISRIGICCGAGAEFVDKAVELSCEAFLTGEAKYHEFLDAKASGVSLITAGHYETEIPVIPVLTDKIKTKFPDIEVYEYLSGNVIITE